MSPTLEPNVLDDLEATLLEGVAISDAFFKIFGLTRYDSTGLYPHLEDTAVYYGETPSENADLK